MMDAAGWLGHKSSPASICSVRLVADEPCSATASQPERQKPLIYELFTHLEQSFESSYITESAEDSS